eukprot:8783547-Heterocapsa_arctica.AAC.1
MGHSTHDEPGMDRLHQRRCLCAGAAHPHGAQDGGPAGTMHDAEATRGLEQVRQVHQMQPVPRSPASVKKTKQPLDLLNLHVLRRIRVVAAWAMSRQ